MKREGRALRSFLIWAALVLVTVALSVEGYFVYRFYEGLTASVPKVTADRTDDEAKDQASNGATPGATAVKTRESAFVHRATTENTFGNSTYLDDPLANDNPDVLLSVTHSWNPGGGPGTYNDHAVGVWYNPEVRRWAIFNQDRRDVPDGVAFNVVILKDVAGAR